MVIVIREDATRQEIDHIIERIERLGLEVHVSMGDSQTIIGAIGDETILEGQPIQAIPGVEKVLPIVKPYKRASRGFHPSDTLISCGSCEIGGDTLAVIAGPPAVESEEQVKKTADTILQTGLTAFRSAAFKPRTSPYSFQGLGKSGLEILSRLSADTGLPVVSEVLDPRNLEQITAHVQLIQIGSNNIQNFDLLREAGKSGKPVILKRGIMNTLEEFLLSAEYILSNGNSNVVLCDCGVRTFEQSTRYSLNPAAVSFLKKETHLPVITDPSQASGNWALVESAAMASVAAGCDGVAIDVHPDPENAMVHGVQSLTPSRFAKLVEKLRLIRQIVTGGEA